MSDLHPAAVGPQPDHTAAEPASDGPPAPTISDAAMLLMHGILGEVLGEIRALAAQVPTASANVARFDALRARLATVFDPPKSKP